MTLSQEQALDSKQSTHLKTNYSMSFEPPRTEETYILISYLDPGRQISKERIDLILGSEKYTCIRPPRRTASQVILRTKGAVDTQVCISAEIGGIRIDLRHHTRPLDRAYAEHLARKQLSEYIGERKAGRLKNETLWEAYEMLVAGRFDRPIRNERINSSFFWQRASNYDKLDLADATSHLKLYKGSEWLDREGVMPTTATIVIPVYGQALHTTCCLLSTLEERRRNYAYDRISVQIIVVDDCSTAKQDVELMRDLEQMEIIKLIEKRHNSGFIDSCNEGAKKANGGIIVFLNNDTEVMDNWLHELTHLLDDPEIGLTGSKLLYPDGTLQEAGGIIWTNGNAWNYGRGARDPHLPEYSYLREVDYISGASIAIRRDDLESLGYFSEEFKPAYCEDSDLALRVRFNLGKKVVFSPFSMVIHHEGKSCGTDLHSGTKSYQTINSRKLLEKWGETLAKYQLEDSTHLFHARGRSQRQTTILVIDHYIPEPDKDAGSRTIFSFIATLSKLGLRIVFWPENLYASPYCKRLQRLGVEVMYFTEEWCPTFEDWMSTNGQYIDVALFSRPSSMRSYADTFGRHSDAPIIYYGHDLHHRRIRLEHSSTEIRNTHKEIQALRDEEFAWENSSLVLYPTAEEVLIVERHLRGNKRVKTVQAYCMPIEKQNKEGLRRNKATGPYRLLFVGGFSHSPNVDAVKWFCSSIFPDLNRQVDCTLSIVGSHPPQEIQTLASDSIKVLGYVDDQRLDALYYESDIAVVPLRFGAGIKGKVIEAFSKCIPVVTTNVGLQGVTWPEQLAYVGDEPEEFRQAVLQAISDLSDSQRSQTITSNAISYVRSNFSEESMMNEWSSILRMVAPTEGGTPG